MGKKKKFTHFNERWLKRAKSNIHLQVMCESDIKKIVTCHFPLNINEFDVLNEFINFKNITLIKIM